MATSKEMTLNEKVLEALIDRVQRKPNKPFLTKQIINTVASKYPDVNKQSIYPLFSYDLLKKKIIKRTGEKSGSSFYMKIIAPADEILELFYGKNGQPRTPAKRKAKPRGPAEKPLESKPTEKIQSVDEISDVVFGQKVFRYWAIMNQRIADLENEISIYKRDQEQDVAQLRKELKDTQLLCNTLRTDNSRLRKQSEQRVHRTMYLEVKKERDRLRDQLDLANERLASLTGKRGATFKLDDILKVKS